MISNDVVIKIVDTSKDAPMYNEEFTPVKMKKCIIVGKGTVTGNPTIDIQLEDEAGNKYLIMATGGLIEMIAGAITGKRLQGAN